MKQAHKGTITFLIVGVFLFLLALPAIAENITLQVMHRWSGDRQPLLREILDRFEAAHPGVTVLDSQVGSSLNQKLTVNWLGGTGPDIAMVNMSSGPSFGSKGFLLPLGPLAAAEGVAFDSLIYPGTAEEIVFEGQIYYLPMTINVGRHLMYYNRDLFEEAGLNADKPPTDHTAWLATAKKLTRVDAENQVAQRGVDLIYSGRDERNYMVLEALVEQRGLGIFDRAGTKAVPDVPGVLSVMNWMLDFNQRLDGSAPSGSGDGRPRFENEEVAMYMGIDGDWFLFSEDNPDLNMGLAPLPAPDGEPLRSKVAAGWGWGISSSTKYPELAWELLKWLSVDPQGGGWFIQQQGRMSSNPRVNLDPAYLEIHPYWNVLGSVASAGAPGGNRCVGLTAGEVYKAIGSILPAAAVGEADPQSALNEAAKVLQASCDSSK